MNSLRSILFNWRILASLVALIAVTAAVVLWLRDGAWPYGAMPDKGVFRTAIFAVSGIVCLALSSALARPTKK